MKLYLSQSFNKAIFSGETISSLIFTFLILLSLHYYSKKNRLLTVALTGLSLVGGFFIGSGLSNTIQSATPIFGLPINALLVSIFFDEYNLIGSVFAAQLLGTLLAILLFFIYKKVFAIKNNIELQHTNLNIQQNVLKEIIAQIIFSLGVIFILYMNFKNNLTSTNTSMVLNSLIVLIFLSALLVIFKPMNEFIVSPFITLAIFLFSTKDNIKKTVVGLSLNNTIHISTIVAVGFIAQNIRWW